MAFAATFCVKEMGFLSASWWAQVDPSACVYKWRGDKSWKHSPLNRDVVVDDDVVVRWADISSAPHPPMSDVFCDVSKTEGKVMRNREGEQEIFCFVF